jgi:D-serine deaminase-like pyridoxal phosphate-dependent protein
MVAAGIDDVLLANEIVTPAKADRLAKLAHHAKTALAIDSGRGVEVIAKAAARAGVVVGALVDVDVGLGRCGVQGPDEGVTIGRMIAESPGLRFLGIMGYEGRIRASDSKRGHRLAEASARLAAVREALESAGLPCTVVSAGGTSTLLEAAANPIITEIQAGTYALWEEDLNGLDLPFRPAVAISATVISRKDSRVILDAGRKSISCDYGPPTPLTPHAAILDIHEEHSVLQWHGVPPDLGTRVELRPRHVRLTFNLHDEVWLTRGDQVIERLPVSARGRSQ